MRHSSRSNVSAPIAAARNDSPSHVDSKRRRFLLTLGAGSASAVAIGAAPNAIACNEPPPAGDDAAGYRVTEHVRDYYRTAKI
jgi:hypothetical protein